MSLTHKLIIILFFMSVGCTSRTDSASKNLESHGMSTLQRTKYSYIGQAAREIDLKLSFKKEAISIIKASVQVPYNYNSPFQYRWKLGSNVSLVQGSLAGTIDSLQKGEVAEVIIKVKNFNAHENRFVRFEVFGTDPAKRIFSDGIVSSHQESSFESIVQEVEKIHADK